MIDTSVTDTSDNLLARLLQLHPKLIDLSLTRMHRLLDALDRPQDRLPPVIHIAGTNGKGSTLALLQAMLQAAGHTVHAYTSPHLMSFHERIAVRGQPIEEDRLRHYLARCEQANQGADITFFEITTAAALLTFADIPADFVLLEVGLGGRLDATNVVTPVVSIITPVSRDHEDFLGTDIADIAAEKAGIIKLGVPLVLAPQDHAGPVLLAHAEQQNAPVMVGGQDWQSRNAHGGLVYEDQTGLLDLPLPALQGPHQITNAGTAIAAARQLGLGNDAIASGLVQARWPGRLEKLGPGALITPLRQRLPHAEVWLDGGHNEAAAQMLAGWLADYHADRPVHLVVGLLASKSADAYLAAFKPLVGYISCHFVPVEDSTATAAPANLQARAARIGLKATAYPSVAVALANIHDEDSNNEDPDNGDSKNQTKPVLILIAGSLYLAGAVLRANRA